MKTSIHPTPSAEEAAAIVATLVATSSPASGGGDSYGDLKRQRWRLAGLMGSPPPRKLSMDGSLWSYSTWKGMV